MYNIFYDTNGEILWSTTADVSTEIINQQATGGRSHVALDLTNNPNPTTHYVNSEGTALVQKSVFNVTFSSLTPAIDDVVTVTGAPSGTEAFLDDVSQGTMDDTTLTFTMQQPGSYVVRLEKQYYQTHQVTLKVKRYGE